MSGPQPNFGAFRASSLGQHACHARQCLVGGVRFRDPLGELRQNLVGGRSLAVDEAIGDLLQSLTHGLERDRHDGGGEDRKKQVGLATSANEGADAHDDAHVDRCDEGRKGAVDQGAADDDVDVVQAVAKDRDRDRCRESHRGDGFQRSFDDRGERDEVEAEHCARGEKQGAGDHPLELVALVDGSATVSQEDRDDPSHHAGA